MEHIKLIKRVTTPFMQAVPQQVEHFDAYIYAIVKRKPGKDIPDTKFGTDVRLDPCELNWRSRTITVYIPLNINIGIDSENDLQDDWFEAVEAAFLAIIAGCFN